VGKTEKRGRGLQQVVYIEHMCAYYVFKIAVSGIAIYKVLFFNK
jgi:hypothetical protein